jgi:hypothetical protein
MRSALVIATLALFVVGTYADVYMHNPRGSNDRNRETGTNRENANRLFNSQNNAKGGYCWGPEMSYYEGSQLSIEWTAQHGCGSDNPRMYCNIVFQYMCTARSKSTGLTMVRDGLTTDTIPFDQAQAQETNGAGEFTYGMHEPYTHYQGCKTRKRNRGLFLADRGLGTDTAVTTRQSNGEDQHGFECPEERDYYPYWHPSPWKDIAILSHDPASCDFYRSNSENVKGRNWCALPDGETPAPENNQDACEKAGNKWLKAKSHGIGAPDCLAAPVARENHLGNGDAAHFALTYNWTLPKSGSESCISKDDCNCALRIRYNISLFDLGKDGNNPQKGFIDYRSNGEQSPVKNDPTVTVMGVPLELALDTSQVGRTFQDRSHTFHIKPRPKGVTDSVRIYNLNVRGKRGNIVEVYPSVEYDFVPSYLNIRKGDYIHFQWTGCDTNPNNQGEGLQNTDRSNIVQADSPNLGHPVKDDWYKDNAPLFKDEKLRFRMAYLDQNPANCDNTTKDQQNVKNCKKLNMASAYFDGGLVKMDNTGEYYYISTRNNNFSNRDQRGTIRVEALLPTWAVAIVSIGAAAFAGGGAVAGAMFYAKANPHSAAANIFNKF